MRETLFLESLFTASYACQYRTFNGEVDGDMIISTIIYLDKEEELDSEMKLNGIHSMGICHSFTAKGVEIEPVDISVRLNIGNYNK